MSERTRQRRQQQLVGIILYYYLMHNVALRACPAFPDIFSALKTIGMSDARPFDPCFLILRIVEMNNLVLKCRTPSYIFQQLRPEIRVYIDS